MRSNSSTVMERWARAKWCKYVSEYILFSKVPHARDGPPARAAGGPQGQSARGRGEEGLQQYISESDRGAR